MKKFLVFISFLFLFLSVSTVYAGWFGPDRIECDYFSIEIPDGYYIPSRWGYHNTKYDCVYVDSKSDDNPVKTVSVYGESFNQNIKYNIVENFTVDGIVFEKCFNSTYGNCIKANFNKNDHNYTISLDFDKSEDFNMSDYVDFVKEIRETIKTK